MLLLRLGDWKLPLWKWTPYEAAPYKDDPFPCYEVGSAGALSGFPILTVFRLAPITIPTLQLRPIQAHGDLCMLGLSSL